MKQCCACLELKTIDNFYKAKLISSGYESKCKQCRKKGDLCRAKRSYERSKNLSSGRPVQDAPQLWNVRKQDWIEMYEFLKSIGYDLSGGKTIHQQFCEKYNLRPRKRMYEKSIQYTPKQLGLF